MSMSSEASEKQDRYGTLTVNYKNPDNFNFGDDEISRIGSHQSLNLSKSVNQSPKIRNETNFDSINNDLVTDGNLPPKG